MAGIRDDLPVSAQAADCLVVVLNQMESRRRSRRLGGEFPLGMLACEGAYETTLAGDQGPKGRVNLIKEGFGLENMVWELSAWQCEQPGQRGHLSLGD